MTLHIEATTDMKLVAEDFQPSEQLAYAYFPQHLHHITSSILHTFLKHMDSFKVYIIKLRSKVDDKYGHVGAYF